MSCPLAEEYSKRYRTNFRSSAGFLTRKEWRFCVFRAEENRDSGLIKFDTRGGRNIEKGGAGEEYEATRALLAASNATTKPTWTCPRGSRDSLISLRTSRGCVKILAIKRGRFNSLGRRDSREALSFSLESVAPFESKAISRYFIGVDACEETRPGLIDQNYYYYY